MNFLFFSSAAALAAKSESSFCVSLSVCVLFDDYILPRTANQIRSRRAFARESLAITNNLFFSCLNPMEKMPSPSSTPSSSLLCTRSYKWVSVSMNGSWASVAISIVRKFIQTKACMVCCSSLACGEVRTTCARHEMSEPCRTHLALLINHFRFLWIVYTADRFVWLRKKLFYFVFDADSTVAAAAAAPAPPLCGNYSHFLYFVFFLLFASYNLAGWCFVFFSFCDASSLLLPTKRTRNFRRRWQALKVKFILLLII